MARRASRKDRTVDMYKEAGAQVQFCKHILCVTSHTLSDVLPAADADKMDKAIRKIHEAFSKAEDVMFADHPDLGNEYINVFYGAGPDTYVTFDCTNATDVLIREIRRMARAFGEEAVGKFTDEEPAKQD